MNETKLLFDSIIGQGREYFESLLEQPTIETDLLDFKEAFTTGTRKLADDDRKNLSRAIGGFTNTEGGVIVWGVKCNKNAEGRDIVQSLPGIKSPNDFRALLLNSTNEVVQPPVAGVKHESIFKEDGTGFVVTFVPQIDGLPVQSSVSALNGAYYYRSGSNFAVMSPTILADRFGRRPQPRLELVAWYAPHSSEKGCVVNFGLLNTGRGVALHPAITMVHEYLAVRATTVDSNQMQRVDNVLSIESTLSQFGEVHFTENLPLIIHPTRINHFAETRLDAIEIETVFNVNRESSAVIKWTAYADGFVLDGKLALPFGPNVKAKLFQSA